VRWHVSQRPNGNAIGDSSRKESSRRGGDDFVEGEWWPQVRVELRDTTRDRWRNTLDAHLLREFGSMALRALTLGYVETYKARRLRDGAAPATDRNASQAALSRD